VLYERQCGVLQQRIDRQDVSMLFDHVSERGRIWNYCILNVFLSDIIWPPPQEVRNVSTGVNAVHL
jgi:hypothetical protein